VISRILQTTASLNLKTGSYAVTGSNLFIGNQTITGSLIVSGSDVSQTSTFHSSVFLKRSLTIGEADSVAGQVSITSRTPNLTQWSTLDTAKNNTGVIRNSMIIEPIGTAGFDKNNAHSIELTTSSISFQYYDTAKVSGTFSDYTTYLIVERNVSGSTPAPQFTKGLNVSSSLKVTGSLAITGSTNLIGSVTINESRIDTAWTAYTPQWTAASVNPAIGNGTIEGYYKVIGKTCFVRGNIAMGSTTTFGSGEWYVSMPFTASHADAILMTVTLLDNGTAWYNATMAGARAGFNHKAPIQYQNISNGTANDVNSTQPFTWASTDRFIWNGSYEIA
jgi:hypothetical protein